MVDSYESAKVGTVTEARLTLYRSFKQEILETEKEIVGIRNDSFRTLY